MIKALRILEIPIYLLVIALFCFEKGSNGIGSLLMIISITRLWINHITDDTIYKK